MSEATEYFRNPGTGDECKKLLDNLHVIVLYKNPLGTYTAAAFNQHEHADVGAKIFDAVAAMPDWGRQHTDHNEPTKALALLTDKVLGTGVYRDWPPPIGQPGEELQDL